MTEDILKYADVFPPGMRIEVELPLAEEKQFRDDAKIIFVHQDLLVFQLTRELLPESVTLDTGTVIHLRTGKEGKGYRCRAILLNHDRHSRFKIRLTGAPIPFNDREFFRIDVFIPLAYRPKSAQGLWRLQEALPESPAGSHHPKSDRAEIGATLKQPLPVAANLSGAGVRINIPERFEIDELLDLTLYLPFGQASTMTLVGQVVHVEEVSPAGDPYPLFGTALHFVSLDDAQRETLIGFIQRMEVEQIRRLREQPLLQGEQALTSAVKPLVLNRRVKTTLWAILLTLLFASIVLALVNYRRDRPQGEIERTFEEQIQKLIDRR
ncbi:MAG: DUF5634 family protein [Desulfobulbaceae bacterium]|nr:DUF5634 family protein [Desulfobulbaceae bacterium]